jgi:hypothetical protein
MSDGWIILIFLSGLALLFSYLNPCPPVRLSVTK